MNYSPLSTILFYKFTPIANPELLRLWQWELCRNLDLKGRIIISEHGINGTLGGQKRQLQNYLRSCRDYRELGKLDPKWAPSDCIPFPKLSVKVRGEIITFNFPQLEITKEGVVNGGTHLNSQQLQQLLQDTASQLNKTVAQVIQDQDVVFIDGRNSYEYAVGRFRGAVNPGVLNAKEFIPIVDGGEWDQYRDRPVITYCTGGVRCEILTPLLRARGFSRVFQLDGGIVRYLEESLNQDGLWEGSVYTFDQRMKLPGCASPVGECIHCGGVTEQFHNCQQCQLHVLACPQCWDRASQQCPSCDN